jgi:hypothetical protein
MLNDNPLITITDREIEIRTFETHCKTIAGGMRVPVSDGKGGVMYLGSFDELKALYPQLDSDLTVKIKNKYGLH